LTDVASLSLRFHFGRFYIYLLVIAIAPAVNEVLKITKFAALYRFFETKQSVFIWLEELMFSFDDVFFY